MNDDFHRAITQIRQRLENLAHLGIFYRLVMMNLWPCCRHISFRIRFAELVLSNSAKNNDFEWQFKRRNLDMVIDLLGKHDLLRRLTQ